MHSSELHVTENLYTALQYLRLPYQDRLLWIDAICINQDDNEERGHQVGQMRLVYKRAEHVLIWLGSSDPDIDDFFEEIDVSYLQTVRRAGYKANTFKHYPIIQAEFRIKYQRVITRIMARPWFRRVWVLQEVATARAATIMCSHKSMSTQLFAMIPVIFDFFIPSHCQAVLDIMPGHSNRLSWWGEKQDLHTLLVKFAASEASDERDKVFALLGISSDAYNSNQLLPDYRKDSRHVIQETWSFLLFHEVLDTSLYRFPVLDMIEFLRVLDRLPEWTLDWSLNRGCDEVVMRLFGIWDNNVSHTWANERPLLCSFAERGGHENLFQHIVSHKNVDVNVVDGLGDTPLHKAIRAGQHNKVEMLLDRIGVSVNSKDRGKFTPLSRAVHLGQEALVNLLLAHPRIDVLHGDGKQMPIALARLIGNKNILMALLARQAIGVNHGVKAAEAVSDETREQKHEGAIPTLDSNGKLIYGKKEGWELALETAILSGSILDIKTILTCEGVDINRLIQWEVKTNLDLGITVSSPLWLSVRLADERVVKLLLEEGADAQKPDVEAGLSHLASAIKRGDTSMAQLLRSHEASLGPQIEAGNKVAMVRFLLNWIKQPENKIVLQKWWFLEAAQLKTDGTDLALKGGEGSLEAASGKPSASTLLFEWVDVENGHATEQGAVSMRQNRPGMECVVFQSRLPNKHRK
ncbi:Heterokaryon incompatibility protein 6, OR allele [Cytospora mali]|uniref:Heterokaryon incompatibility protein 6, OR allele n=1 Tax=Cytospora mali TaxID=578113 RepID=A0A194VAH8_CYTMA|nr:Heterokaryon incompatibility protein 6, OR allele [Valsa mali var. pyri (nom. inval.)]